MAYGSNIELGTHSHIWAEILKKIGVSTVAGLGSEGFLLMKDGAPVDNTAADDPAKVGVFIWDYTNSDVYVCTAYTDSTTFTVTKVWD